MGQLSDEDLHMLLTERDIDRDNDGRVGLEGKQTGASAAGPFTSC